MVGLPFINIYIENVIMFICIIVESTWKLEKSRNLDAKYLLSRLTTREAKNSEKSTKKLIICIILV